mmetsp:Transcript_42187/g.95381  ORF Transcript_42187/g.95381 Transcript_42187/m.95381 type:complete len:260 (-) Transcript_42187:1455-2234(-)
MLLLRLLLLLFDRKAFGKSFGKAFGKAFGKGGGPRQGGGIGGDAVGGPLRPLRVEGGARERGRGQEDDRLAEKVERCAHRQRIQAAVQQGEPGGEGLPALGSPGHRQDHPGDAGGRAGRLRDPRAQRLGRPQQGKAAGPTPRRFGVGRDEHDGRGDEAAADHHGRGGRHGRQRGPRRRPGTHQRYQTIQGSLHLHLQRPAAREDPLAGGPLLRPEAPPTHQGPNRRACRTGGAYKRLGAGAECGGAPGRELRQRHPAGA